VHRRREHLSREVGNHLTVTDTTSEITDDRCLVAVIEDDERGRV
jgi:hypothetical protein